jgi:hypothetical protein
MDYVGSNPHMEVSTCIHNSFRCEPEQWISSILNGLSSNEGKARQVISRTDPLWPFYCSFRYILPSLYQQYESSKYADVFSLHNTRTLGRALINYLVLPSLEDSTWSTESVRKRHSRLESVCCILRFTLITGGFSKFMKLQYKWGNDFTSRAHLKDITALPANSHAFNPLEHSCFYMYHLH